MVNTSAPRAMSRSVSGASARPAAIISAVSPLSWSRWLTFAPKSRTSETVARSPFQLAVISRSFASDVNAAISPLGSK
jgi:hypothetical protein